MKRPLATLVTLLLVSALFVGFATGPAAAQTCSSTATSTQVGVSSASVDVGVDATQINVASNVQAAATAISVGGDAQAIQTSDIDQINVVETCDG